MRRSLVILAVATVLSVVASVSVVSWLEHDDSMSIEFSDNKILLNVPLRSPKTCQEVFDELGIDDIPYKGKVYSPVCTTVKPTLIVVTYKEKVMI